jgi:nucleotide-binding universal stress UspA family protein
MRIILAVDGSKFSEAAANEVIAQMNPDNIEVTLLHVLDPFPAALAEKVGSKESPEFDLARLTLRDAANEYVGRTAETFRSAGFRCLFGRRG